MSESQHSSAGASPIFVFLLDGQEIGYKLVEGQTRLIYQGRRR